jgi:two-component system, chemotaxis family, CheB/CheR fusion protein
MIRKAPRKRSAPRRPPAKRSPDIATPESPHVDVPSKPSGGSPFPIVGIGASAGGLEAFTQLLRELPTDTGMAFVLVQHLDPTHESQLPEVLSRTTAMPVVAVTDRLHVERDHVYVIPANADMTVGGALFALTPRITGDRHTPIDHFFRSLAQESEGRAVGVVLSGTGSDGTLGLRAIKQEGGITLVQDEKSAKHPGMPQSAAAVADFVLPPAGIARELARIADHPYVDHAVPSTAGPEQQEGGADVGAVLRVLRTSTGVDFSQYKPASVRRRIARRMMLGRIDDLGMYARRLRETPGEAQALHDDLLIQVTGFFRDPEGFEALRQSVFPSLVKERADDEPIRIWVPGCATGEEAYSLVICLLEFLGEQDRHTPIQVFATDLSAAAVIRARTGTFPASIEGEVSTERLRRFFVKVNGRYQISKAIRDVCVFAQQDLSRDPPFSKLDLISCCNLLIYLSAALQERVIPVLHYALKPTGFLKLGPSESIGRFTSLFSVVDKKHKIHARKPGPSAHLGFGLSAGDRLAAPTGPQQREAGWSGTAIEKEADRLILGRYAPAGVVVNADMQIVQFRGKTGPYLEAAPGAASLELFKMAREGLQAALRQAVQRAAKRGGPVKAEGLRIRANGGVREVGVEVIPIGPAEGAKGRHYLVLFVEGRHRAAGPVPPTPAQEREPQPKTAHERRVAQLTRELADAHRHLQAIGEEHEAAMEELRAATEEAQSSNEELQSTNEELETSKEELQATNEELTTVNDELNSRNLELRQLSDDLGNVLASTHVPIIIVATDLRVRRITPVTERILNVAPGDVGRPIGDLRLSVEVPDLEALLRQVIETLTVQEREVQARDGRWYSARVRPYRTADNRIDGAVISFVDIDALKRGRDVATAARDQAQAIVETVRGPLMILDADLRVVSANRAFYETFQVADAETECRSLFDLGNRQWDIPRLRTLLEEILPRDGVVEGFEVEHHFETIGRRLMLLNARRVLRATDQSPLILLGIEDVTERRREAEAIRYLGAIVESSEDAIVSATLDGVITSWNRGAEQMFGYAADEVIGGPINVLIPPDRLDEELNILTRLRRGEGGQYDATRVRKDGARLDVALTVSPIHDTTGRIIGASRIARDISVRKRVELAQAELLGREQRVSAEAQAATLAKDKFLAVLSHELRTPLSAMLGWVRILRTHRLNPAATARALEVIERNTLLQVRLIEDLLDVSRIVSGTLHVEVRPVAVAPTVKATLAMMQLAAEAKGVRLESAVDEKAGLVLADPARLQQIVSNLVSNSIKFTPSGRRVEVRLARRGSMVEISVSDTGKGITAEQLPQIFTPFGAAHASTQHQGGMGLGLTIVRHLVELQRGVVRAESPGLGHGATFTVTLPRTDERADEVVAGELASRGLAHGQLPALNGVRILAVDDEADARDLLSTIFAQYGAVVTVVASVREALTALHQASFDVLVSDIVMPDEDGYDLIRKVRALDAERGGQIQALALTAYARVEDREAVLAAGYQQHAAKPIEPAELAAAVATLAGRIPERRGGG